MKTLQLLISVKLLTFFDVKTLFSTQPSSATWAFLISKSHLSSFQYK
jgi:hypothetical protein